MLLMSVKENIDLGNSLYLKLLLIDITQKQAIFIKSQHQIWHLKYGIVFLTIPEYNYCLHANYF